MKLLFLVSLLALNGVTLAQIAPSSLVDEFSDPNCEDLWARLDNFLIQINNNPGSVATVSISGKVGGLRDDLYYESQIKTYFNRRGVDRQRIRLIRTKAQSRRSVQFWLTAPGGVLPTMEADEWSLLHRRGSRPYVFVRANSNIEDVEDICLAADEIDLLATVLMANPTARTNVVLFVRSGQEFKRRVRQVLGQLDKYHIPREQVRIFRSKPTPKIFAWDTEYWLVP